MAGNQDQMDQDAIAAQWEASLDSEDPAAAAEARSSVPRGASRSVKAKEPSAAG